jgi:hypothetical protein
MPAKCLSISNTSEIAISPFPSTSPQENAGTGAAETVKVAVVKIDKTIAVINNKDNSFFFIIKIPFFFSVNFREIFYTALILT